MTINIIEKKDDRDAASLCEYSIKLENERDYWKNRALKSNSLLSEWLATPFFETYESWKKWVDSFKPRVEAHLWNEEYNV